MSIATGLCVAITLPLWFVDPASRPERTPVDWPALAWLVALTLSALFALDREASLHRLGKGLMPLLVLLTAWHGRDAVVRRRALGVLMVSAGAAALFGLVSFGLRGASLAARARGPTGHYMTFAGQLLLVGCLLAGVAVLARNRAWRVAAIAAGTVLAAALAATFTRSAWLGGVVALGIVTAAARPRWTPALVIGVVLLVAVAPPSYRARALSAFDPSHPTNRERTYMWQAGLRMFRDRPLTGVGLQDMKPVYDRYKPVAARERAGHLHSVPIHVAATTGLVGLVAFAWLYGSLFRAATRGLRPMLRRGGLDAGIRLGVAAGLAGFLVAGLFEWNFGDEELLYLLYTLVGLAWAARAGISAASVPRVAEAEAPVLAGHGSA